MLIPPEITVVIPWDYSRLAKSLQAYSRKTAGIKLGGNTQGLRMTATTRTFLKMRLAKVSDQYDLPLVSRLREADLSVTGSRTVHLPGNLSVVEIKLDASPKVAHKAATALIGSAGAQVVTVYDRAGKGHTRAQEGVTIGQGSDGVGRAGGRQGSMGRVQAGREKVAAQNEALVRAIKEIWENKGDEFTPPADPDSSDYEPYTTQEIVAGYIGEYLTPEQKKKWEDLEPEEQTYILNAAFPEDTIKDAAFRLERHFLNQTRGASREATSSPEGRLDPLDYGKVRNPELVRMNNGGTIHKLFS